MADHLDQIFGAYDIRGVVGENLDSPTARRIARAYGDHVTPDRPGRYLVGHDARLTSPALAEAVSVGLREGGHHVVHLGQATTPMTYWVGAEEGFDGSVTVTASHLPPEHNGMKLCRDDAKPLSVEDGLPEIEAAVRRALVEGDPPPASPTDEVTGRIDRMEVYVAALRRFLAPSRPLRIAVDASCGVGGVDTERLLSPVDPVASAGLEVWFLNTAPDGRFPAHSGNPLDEDATTELSALVVERGLDLGVAYDGDADRLVAVDETGARLGPGTLGGLLALRLLEGAPGATVLYDLRASRALPEVIAAHGGVPQRTRVGHAIIKPAMRAADAVFAAELSGHYYYCDLHVTDSGLRSLIELVNLVAASDRPLSVLRRPFDVYPTAAEANREVADRAAVLAGLEAAYVADGLTVEHLDGLSVDGDDWWANVRASNTEPVIRVNVGATTADRLAAVQATLWARVDALAGPT